DLKEKEALISGLLNQIISDKLYTRHADDYFELFFYVDDLIHGNAQNVSIQDLTSPTFYAPNVSMFNQRMGEGSDAVMVSTAASFGNHTHANGISIELFANNYVLGPDSGKGPSYWHPTFRDYYARMPAHNTVVVDGKSDYNNMRSYNPFVLDNAYPESGKISNFDKITFSKVSFVEPKTKSDQQRFTAIIKSNTTQKYIVDVFRSKKQKPGKQKHEYIYRNLGQSLELFNTKGRTLKLSATNDLSSDKGDLKGYDFFTNKFKIQTSDEVTALFTLKSENQPNNYMKLWVKGSDNQNIYCVESPKSNALSKGTAPTEVLDKPLPTLILKRDEAAWVNPFAVVFNPFIEGETNGIENVSYTSLENYPNAQFISIEQSDNIKDEIVLNTSDEDVVKQDDFFQRGLLSIERYSEGNLNFMFLSGMIKYENKGWDIVASGNPFTMSIEKIAHGYLIQNDEPITINMPFKSGKEPAELRLYKDDVLVTSRKGTVNRNNSNQLVFKLEKGYNKAEIIYNFQ
ncbi:heparinase II/III-family protein, partial [Algibacter sp.]|nr:heparinase II/III-family protein [Algibacter sp.]